MHSTNEYDFLSVVALLKRFRLGGNAQYDNNVASNVNNDKLELVYNRAEELGFTGILLNTCSN